MKKFYQGADNISIDIKHLVDLINSGNYLEEEIVESLLELEQNVYKLEETLA